MSAALFDNSTHLPVPKPLCMRGGGLGLIIGLSRCRQVIWEQLLIFWLLGENIQRKLIPLAQHFNCEGIWCDRALEVIEGIPLQFRNE